MDPTVQHVARVSVDFLGYSLSGGLQQVDSIPENLLRLLRSWRGEKKREILQLLGWIVVGSVQSLSLSPKLSIHAPSY